MKTYENLTTYNPGEIEGKWYSYWENQGYFHEEVDTNKEPFSIVLPPPNVTGMLHMGHALDNTLQDILIRFKRMQGYIVDARYRPRWYCYTNQSRRDAC
jgi:valyl-tRNA synthetase